MTMMKNKLLTILLSAAIAVGMWVYVITVEQPESEETYYDIPVILQNESILAERGLMIVSERPTVTLQLSSTRTNLNQLNESNINVIANVNSVVTPGTHELTYSVSYPGNIPAGSITRRNSRPDMITLKVENRITKPVPVVPVYSGSVPEGMLADKENALLDYTTIEVAGPASVVEQITQAVIAVDLQDKTETIAQEFVYTLCDDAGEPVNSQWVTTNAEVVNLTLQIKRVKEIELKVTVIPGGGASEQTTAVDIQPSVIRISGSDALLEKLDVLDLGTINLGELTSDTVLSMPIILPEGITNETGITEATVEVKFPNLRTATMIVDKIQLINVPEGMEAELVTQQLEVKLRGPASLMEAITEDNVIITVDLVTGQIGTDKYTAQVTVQSSFAGVGAMNSYTVMVTLTEAD
jgi:hypothetical protein